MHSIYEYESLSVFPAASVHFLQIPWECTGKDKCSKTNKGHLNDSELKFLIEMQIHIGLLQCDETITGGAIWKKSSIFTIFCFSRWTKIKINSQNWSKIWQQLSKSWNFEKLGREWLQNINWKLCHSDLYWVRRPWWHWTSCDEGLLCETCNVTNMWNNEELFHDLIQ